MTGRVLCSASSSEWPSVRNVCAAWPGAIAAYGIHPWNAAEAGVTWPTVLADFLDNDPSAWVGEIGIDAVRQVPMDRQIPLFQQQVSLAKEKQRHIAIHCVRAWNEVHMALRRAGDTPPFLLHAFTGPEQTIPEFAAMGAYFSVGPLTRRHDSSRTRNRMTALPADRIVLESDADVTPPEDAVDALTTTLQWLAEVLHTDAEALAELTTANFRRLRDDE